MSEPLITGYRVRYRGHLCAAVRTGFSRQPILFRAKKEEQSFHVEVDMFGEPGKNRKIARVACARAIRRTEHAFRKLQGDHLLRGVESVERLQKLIAPADITRRGKRWKIIPILTP